MEVKIPQKRIRLESIELPVAKGGLLSSGTWTGEYPLLHALLLTICTKKFKLI
jgi:hypothetical protein